MASRKDVVGTKRESVAADTVAAASSYNYIVPSLSNALELFKISGLVLNVHRVTIEKTPPRRVMLATSTKEPSTPVTNLLDLLATPDGKPTTPAVSNIMVVPQSLLNDDSSSKRSFFPLVQLLSSYTTAAAGALVLKKFPNGFDINTVDGKFAATNAIANATWEIYTQGLSGFYNYTSIGAFEHTITNSSESFHSQFLDTLFKAFAFPENVMTELDGILTLVNTDLISFSTSKNNESEKVSHMINLTTCTKNNFEVWVATSHFFLLSIDMASMHSVWQSGKHNETHESHSYTFNMSYLNTETVMNADLVQEHQDQIKAYLAKMVNTGLEAVEKAASPAALIDPSK